MYSDKYIFFRQNSYFFPKMRGINRIAQTYAYTVITKFRGMTNSDIKKIRQGDITPLGEVYKREKEDFFKWVKKYVWNVSESDLEDAFSDSIVILHRKILSGEKIQYSKYYLYTIGKNCLLNTMRRNEKNAELYGDIPWEDIQDDPWEIEKQILEKALKELGDKSSQLLRLFYLEGKSLQEIKEIMGFKDIKTVSNRKAKSKKALIRYIFNTI